MPDTHSKSMPVICECLDAADLHDAHRAPLSADQNSQSRPSNHSASTPPSAIETNSYYFNSKVNRFAEDSSWIGKTALRYRMKNNELGDSTNFGNIIYNKT